MALLWRDPNAEAVRPGPKPGLSVEAIVDAAIAVADAGGMAALSMRAVGERLSCSGMALYTYVPGKAELIDLMYDRALGELPVHYPGEDDEWREALISWARDTCAFYVRHPWMLQVSQARPVLGPGEHRFLETLACVLCRTGLRPAVLRPVVGTLLHLVRGCAQTIADARWAPAVTGTFEHEWWYARSRLLAEVAPDYAARYPVLVWLHGEDLEESPPPGDASLTYQETEARRTFEAGLAVLLDGVETAMRRADLP
ncbi:TetR/AcrR family transcriptional regulator C-terminal domain-containing protein [Rhizohabitans arisaemae]|uniref:TetR/AcrR family transcriptional regulator C-terminal domain-containing protein n=1 Tax=Rhizohabitans arisaemae TaxID=2720610 RepID=UPI0031FF0DC7